VAFRVVHERVDAVIGHVAARNLRNQVYSELGADAFI
jgi:hypothetical protein